MTGERHLAGTRLLGDLAAAAAAIFAAFWLRLHLPLPLTSDLLPEDRLSFLRDVWWVPIALQLPVLYFFGLYEGRQNPRSEIARRLSRALAVQAALLLAWIFLTNRTFPRSVFLLYVLLDYLLLAVWRSWLQALGRPAARRVIIVGADEEARELALRIGEHGWHGLTVAGHVPAPGGGAAAEADGPLGPNLGGVEDLPRLLRDGLADTVVLTPGQRSWQTALIDRLAERRPARASVLLLPGPFESLIGQMRFRWVRDIPLIDVVRDSEWQVNWPVKRAIDLVGGTVLFLLTLPVLAAGAAAVRLTSRGSVFYRQQRVGRDRREFTLWKLRTMRPDAESDGVEILAAHGDPRLTPVGALLRRTRIDELPQLWNVLGGTMSLVGPRPERPGFTERNLREVPGYAERFVVAPGISGLAQINGEYHSTPQNKLRYDLAYIANWSVWLDLSILLKTVRIVLTSRGL